MFDVSNGQFIQRGVQPDECQEAHLIDGWKLPNTTPGVQQGAPSDGGNTPSTGSPIVINLAGDGFHLTGLEDPVVFDLDADGTAEEVGWTSRGSMDAFLCLDRNGNGMIDDGSELFGNFTRLSDGQRAPDGYTALAEYDKRELGGNQDGVIDRQDAIFSHLCIWIDRNHNGVSEPGEILTLDQAHIIRIELQHSWTPLTDAHGNRFRFVSLAWISDRTGGAHAVLTSDVFFVMED